MLNKIICRDQDIVLEHQEYCIRTINKGSFVYGQNSSLDIVLLLYGNLEQVTYAWRKIGLFWFKKSICDCSRSNQMPERDQITEITPYGRSYFWGII